MKDNLKAEIIASLKYRISDYGEGFDYTFEGYSDWKELDDEKFQKLRYQYLDAKKELKDYIESL